MTIITSESGHQTQRLARQPSHLALAELVVSLVVEIATMLRLDELHGPVFFVRDAPIVSTIRYFKYRARIWRRPWPISSLIMSRARSSRAFSLSVFRSFLEGPPAAGHGQPVSSS